MKFSCERAVLAEAVATAGHAVLPRSSNPVLEGLLLSLRGDQLSLTGYDGETGIRCLLSVAGLSDGDILLPVYFKEPEAGQYSTAVLRCQFDGETLSYVEHGDELSFCHGEFQIAQHRFQTKAFEASVRYLSRR